MSSRPTRSTRAKIVYTEDNDDLQPSNSISERRPLKRKRTNGKSIGGHNFKETTSSDTSSLTSLGDSQSNPLDVLPSPPSSRKRPPTNQTITCLSSSQGLQEARKSHTLSYHTSHFLGQYGNISASLLEWFDRVKEHREMPWRKEVKDLDACTPEQKGQRAYEVWVSEIMLQQTQVETVKSYYLKWMSRFPTIFELSKANVEQVNEYWQGLGYYSRASRLLSGAKKVVEKFNGILPDDPIVMEKEVDGIGPYSAGAIASIAYAKPVPMVDGNVHRVLTRLSALHAPQAAKATTKFLWSLAAKLVPQLRPGDFNQALMELGATVCKPREALCSTCPLNQWCRAYQEQGPILCPGEDEVSASADCADIEDTCTLCQPKGTSTSSSSQHVLIYPMAKERKKPGIREVAVAVVIWKERTTHTHDYALENIMSTNGQTKSLLIKRPEKGLLAGLWEFPSVDLPESNDSTTRSRLSRLTSLLREALTEDIPLVTGTEANQSQGSVMVPIANAAMADIGHVFSHLRVTYKPIALVIHSSDPPGLKNAATTVSLAKPGQATWTCCQKILSSNIGNPHKKVWRGLLDLVPV